MCLFQRLQFDFYTIEILEWFAIESHFNEVLNDYSSFSNDKNDFLLLLLHKKLQNKLIASFKTGRQ